MRILEVFFLNPRLQAVLLVTCWALCEVPGCPGGAWQVWDIGGVVGIFHTLGILLQEQEWGQHEVNLPNTILRARLPIDGHPETRDGADR